MPQILLTLGDRMISKYVFDKETITVGRGKENDIAVDNLAISRNHARIKRQGDTYVVYDLESANGTFVNGVRVSEKALAHGDIIGVGKHKLIFKSEAAEELAILDRPDFEKTVLVDTPTAACLIAMRGKWKGSEFQLDKPEVVIGSGKDCAIRLTDWFVARHHATISRRGKSFVLRDVGSWRGTKVNGSSVRETQLKDGDEIQIGGTTFLFRGAGEITPIRTPTPPQRTPPEEERRPDWESTPAAREEKKVQPISTAEEEPIAAGGWGDYVSPTAREPSAVPSEASVQGKSEKAEVVDFLPGGRDLHATERLVSVTEPTTPRPLEPDRSKADTGKIDLAESAAVTPVEQQATPSVAEQGPQVEEIRVWEEALRNKSPIIRKQAARMLKKLTGKDYDY